MKTSKYEIACDLLNNGQNVKECDATAADSRDAAGYILLIILNRTVPLSDIAVIPITPLTAQSLTPYLCGTTICTWLLNITVMKMQ